MVDPPEGRSSHEDPGRYRARHNVGEYEDRPISLEDLDWILEAGRRTPSSMNQQRWDFVVVTDREELQRPAQVWQGAGHVARSARRSAWSHR